MVRQGLGHLISIKPDHFAAHFQGWIDAEQGLLKALRDRFPKDSALTIELTRAELRLVVKSLADLTDGFSLPEWEFATITGFSRDQMRMLLHALHRLAVTSSK